MNILLLGGTSDAITLTKRLLEFNVNLIYSIAGIVRQPQLNCRIHSGGFQGKLADYLQQQHINMLIDATHPYAVNISQQANQACTTTATPYLQYIRPAWQPKKNDNWISFDTIDSLLEHLKPYKNPFFTLGQKPIDYLDKIPDKQYWLIRTATQSNLKHPRASIIKQIGSLKISDELELFKQYQIDTLICKNSGSGKVSAKLSIARRLNLPVFMQNRPSEKVQGYYFSNINDIIKIISREKIYSSSPCTASKFRGIC